MAKKSTPAVKGNTELVVRNHPGELIPTERFSILLDPSDMEVVTSNLSEESISEFDLPRIKVPAGGGTFWEVENIEGELESKAEISGVILSVGIRKSYWEDQGTTGSPPDCQSTNGTIGIGNPGGQCLSCPHSQFGTAINQDGTPGKGKRCRETRCILLLREGDFMPTLILAPPTSIGGYKKYVLGLRVHLYQAYTTLTLEKGKSDGGQDYSTIKFSYSGFMHDDVVGSLKEYGDSLKKAINGLVLDDRDDSPAPSAFDGPDNPGDYSA